MSNIPTTNMTVPVHMVAQVEPVAPKGMVQSSGADCI